MINTNQREFTHRYFSVPRFNDTAVTVVAGTNYLNKDGDRYQSKRIISHPSYSSMLIRNDVGLIYVDKDIVFGDKVQPVKLPTQDFNKTDYPATLSGWGTTSVNIYTRLVYFTLWFIDFL